MGQKQAATPAPALFVQFLYTAAGYERLGAASANCCRCIQASQAYAHLAVKRQPGFGLMGEEISPFVMICFLWSRRSTEGIAESNTFV